jgi:RNA polymerase sigma factor (sigma-70 family)
MKALARRPGSSSRSFESLYRRHVEDVYRYTLALLDRPADAEDATQTTFLNAYRALERGERPRDARPWLRAIALNVCREHYRRARSRPDEVSLEEDPGELVLDPPTPAIGDVVRALGQLPFNQRAALVMREFEGRSVAEIAAALGTSASSVEALLFRARRGLREQLEGTLNCAEAEQAISRQLDGALPRDERGPLRAHLRQCPDCASLARRLRAQRSAIRSLAVIPVPASLKLGQLFGGGAAASVPAGAAVSGSAGGSFLVSLAGSATAKFVVATVAGATAVGVGYVSLAHKASRPAAATRSASKAEPRVAPGGGHAKLSGREDLTSSSRLLVPPPRPSGKEAARRGGAHARPAANRATSHGGATAATAPPIAPGRGHVSAGARVHGRGHPPTIAPSTVATTPSTIASEPRRGGRHPQPKPPTPHPTQLQEPQPPLVKPTTPAPPPKANHGVGNSTGNGNAKH